MPVPSPTTMLRHEDRAARWRRGALASMPMAPGAAVTAASPAVLNHTQPRLQDERPIDLGGYADQVVLVVHTASFCGVTKQHQGREDLNCKYAGRGLVVLGVPSNDFGRPEPGSNAQIADFCESTFGVRCPMFAKSSVAGAKANPVFKGLADRTGETPGWNFRKCLMSRDGSEVLSFTSAVAPQSRLMTREIERLLSKK